MYFALESCFILAHRSFSQANLTEVECLTQATGYRQSIGQRHSYVETHEKLEDMLDIFSVSIR